MSSRRNSSTKIPIYKDHSSEDDSDYISEEEKTEVGTKVGTKGRRTKKNTGGKNNIDEVKEDEVKASGLKNDVNLLNPDEDLTGTDLIKFYIKNKSLFQVKLPDASLEALNTPGVSEAIKEFHLRETVDYASPKGKIMTWIRGWGGNKDKAAKWHSIETFGQALPFVNRFMLFWLTNYGSLCPHAAFYVPELNESLEACIDWHRDTAKFFARMCITLCGVKTIKKTLFRAKKFGAKQPRKTQIILDSPHGSVLFFDQASSGFNSNVYHNTSVKNGHSMTLVFDLYLYKGKEGTTLEEVVKEMIGEGIFQMMQMNYRVPSNKKGKK